MTDTEFFKLTHLGNPKVRKCSKQIFTVMFCNKGKAQINKVSFSSSLETCDCKRSLF